MFVNILFSKVTTYLLQDLLQDVLCFPPIYMANIDCFLGGPYGVILKMSSRG